MEQKELGNEKDRDTLLLATATIQGYGVVLFLISLAFGATAGFLVSMIRGFVAISALSLVGAVLMGWITWNSKDALDKWEKIYKPDRGSRTRRE